MGRTISIKLFTSGGSGFGKTVEKLRPSTASTATWKEGKLLNGKLSADAIVSWTQGPCM